MPMRPAAALSSRHPMSAANLSGVGASMSGEPDGCSDDPAVAANAVFVVTADRDRHILEAPA